MPKIHISLAAETLFTVFGLPVSNSILTTWVVMILVIIFALSVNRRLKMIPGNLQTIAELIVGGIHSLFEEILHDQTKRFFPFLATIFIFIIFNNWIGLLPGVGTVGLYKQETVSHAGIGSVLASEENAADPVTGEEPQTAFVPLFRAGTADLNTTFALAIMTMAYIQFAGLSSLGAVYLKKFFDISNPINFVVGILELISEISRVISFAFRLFGNIFAGEVLLTVMAFLVPLFAPIPFLGLEIFVGFIQAIVFSMLAAVFFSMAVAKH